MAETTEIDKEALFDGDEKEAAFWKRLRSTLKKSEIMNELIDLRWLHIENKLPKEDEKYFAKVLELDSLLSN